MDAFHRVDEAQLPALPNKSLLGVPRLEMRTCLDKSLLIKLS